MKYPEVSSPHANVERLQFYKDILITAVEGGVNYWCRVSPGTYEPDAGRVTLVEDENPKGKKRKRYALTWPSIQRAVQLVLDPKFRIREDLRDTLRRAYVTCESGDIDAELADCIVQAAIYGEIVFG